MKYHILTTIVGATLFVGALFGYTLIGDTSESGFRSLASTGQCDRNIVASNRTQIAVLWLDEVGKVQKHYASKAKGAAAAFYDCQRDMLVVPYHYRGENSDEFGLRIVDELADEGRDYPLRDGLNTAIDRYGSGVLVSTGLLHQEDGRLADSVDSPGYIYTHLFDLAEGSITQSYKHLVTKGEVFGDTLYAAGDDNLITIDLNTGDIKEVANLSPSTSPMGGMEFTIPSQSETVVHHGHFYVIPTAQSFDRIGASGFRSMAHFETSYIYRLEEGGLEKVARCGQFESPLVRVFDKNLVIIERNLSKAAVMNITSQTCSEKPLPASLAELGEGFSLTQVGRWMILSVNGVTKSEGDSYLVVMDSEFSEIHDKFTLEGDQYRITSNQGIDFF